MLPVIAQFPIFVLSQGEFLMFVSAKLQIKIIFTSWEQIIVRLFHLLHHTGKSFNENILISHQPQCL